MIITANERIYLQTRNITHVNDDPDKDVVTVYFNTSSEMFQKAASYRGQDRRDVLDALSGASYHREG